jgi:uncharacterized protein
MLYLLGLAASLLIGVSLGLIGGGGSIITVPVLIYLLRVPVHEAIGMSLLVVGITSAAGAYLHHRKGAHLDIKSGLLFGSAGLIGAYFGSLVSYLVPEKLLLLMFSLLMMIIAILMLRGPREARGTGRAPLWKTLPAGISIGFLTGFLGVGGGFLIVPALVFLQRLNTRTAIGTSLLVISMNCAAGLAGHLTAESFQLTQIMLISILALSGLLAGTILSRHSSPQQLRRFFAFFVLAVGIGLFVFNI